MPSHALGHTKPDTSTRLRASDGFATRAIRAGQDPCAATGATIVPVYQTATFTVDGPGDDKGFDYSRTANPTRSAFEAQIAALEGRRVRPRVRVGDGGGRGRMRTAAPGDHLVATRDCLWRHLPLLRRRPRAGRDRRARSSTRRARTASPPRCGPTTKLLWIETPTNPLLRVADIAAIAALRTARADARGRQHVLFAVLSAPARTRRRRRRPLDDQVRQRPQRRRRRRARPRRPAALRGARVLSKRRRRRARPAGRLPDAARREDARVAHAAART